MLGIYFDVILVFFKPQKEKTRVRMKKNIPILFLLLHFNLFCQSGEQNIAIKEIITKTISNNEDEFKNQDVIYFEIPPFLKTTSINETYSFEKQKNYTICILNEREVFDSEKIEFCYKINLAEEKTNLIQVFRVIHPSIGIGRTFIYEFNKPDR